MLNLRTAQTQLASLAQTVIAENQGSMLLQQDRRLQVLMF